VVKKTEAWASSRLFFPQVEIPVKFAYKHTFKPFMNIQDKRTKFLKITIFLRCLITLFLFVSISTLPNHSGCGGEGANALLVPPCWRGSWVGLIANLDDMEKRNFGSGGFMIML
jgi:hypothetical protein